MTALPENLEVNDFMAVEPHIVERVRMAVAGLSPAVHVLTSADLEGVKEAGQKTPAVHVVYGGFKVVPNDRTDGGQALLEHTWLVVSVDRKANQVRSGSANRQAVGRLAARAGAYVMGSRPPKTTGPLLLAPSPPLYWRAGYGYLPLAFKVSTVFNNVR